MDAAEALREGSDGVRAQAQHTVSPFTLYRRAVTFQLGAQTMSPPHQEAGGIKQVGIG